MGDSKETILTGTFGELYENQELFKIGILRICEELHMNNTGSFPDLEDETRKHYLNYLIFRLKKWTNNNQNILTNEYDKAVKNLMKQTITETLVENLRRETK